MAATQTASVPTGPISARPFSVVLFTNSFMMGGMEEHIRVLAVGLAQGGARVAVLCPDDDVIAPLREALAIGGVEVTPLPSQQRNPLGFVRRLRALTRLLRQYRPFVFHLHNTGSDGGTLPMLAAKLAGARVMLRTEHQPPDQPVSLRKQFMIRLRDRALDRVICVSGANLEEHVRDLRRSPRKFVAIPNGVDAGRFDPATDRRPVRELAGAGDNTVVVGTLGRMAEPRKGVEYFVDMARIMAADPVDYRFVVVGEGPRRAQLEARADGTVLFLGRYADAAHCYAAFDVYVQPSLWEGGPITVLEALVMGRPTVSTGVGMVPEVIADGVHGRVVPPADSSALAEAVRSLVADRAAARRMGEAGRERVLARFTTEAMIESHVRLYEELASAPLTRPS